MPLLVWLVSSRGPYPRFRRPGGTLVEVARPHLAVSTVVQHHRRVMDRPNTTQVQRVAPCAGDTTLFLLVPLCPTGRVLSSPGRSRCSVPSLGVSHPNGILERFPSRPSCPSAVRYHSATARVLSRSLPSSRRAHPPTWYSTLHGFPLFFPQTIFKSDAAGP